MKPLSIRKRRWYLIVCAIVFIAAIPVLILYASGYRMNFSEVFQFLPTGGFYVSAIESGSEVYIDGTLVKKVGRFQGGTLIQNLKPGSYDIKVVKGGFQTWQKKAAVFPETVTEIRSFTFPESPIVMPIDQFLPAEKTLSTSTSSTTNPKTGETPNPEYTRISALFATSSIRNSLTIGTTTEIVRTLRRIVVINEEGVLHVKWTGKTEETPSYFCEHEMCKEKIVVKTPAPVKWFDFFPGRDDLLVVSLPDGVYVIEIDDRLPQNIQKLFSGKNVEFRAEDSDRIYLKEGKFLYLVTL